MNTQVTDMSGLGNCSNLHTLNLSYTQVTDVSSLGSCSSLHTLHLEGKESQVKELLDQLTECRRTPSGDDSGPNSDRGFLGL